MLAEPWLHTERSIFIGIDEAGRGCLAGPVYAGAVILTSEKFVSDVRDSKILSESRREKLCDLIISTHRVGIGIATVEEIVRFNILQAALLAMKRAFDSMQLSEKELLDCHVLVDGNQKIKGLNCLQTTVIQGDSKVKSISAASIVAKVMRDRELRRLDKMFPQYGYAKHKGYGTAEHCKAIKEFGPTEHHRSTFAGVKEYVRI